MKQKRRLPRAVQFIKKKGKWIKAASKLLEISHAAKDGGPLTRVLGGVVAVGEMAEIFYPPDSPWSYFSNRGYEAINTQIDGFLCELLLNSRMDRHIVAATLTDQAYLFVHEDITIGAIYSGGKYSNGPYLLNGNYEDIIDVLREIVWEGGRDIMLSAKKDESYSWRASNKYSIGTTPEPGPYLGVRHDPKKFAERLAKYGREPRSVLLRGTTGVGKSVFARHVAKHSAKESAKTLKIASSVLARCSFQEVIAMVQLFQPTVLLLDDLSLDDAAKTESFLAMLEALRDPDCLVIATVMTDKADDPDKEPEMGDWHFPGMRPGRIDEILTFYLPNTEERNLILRHYLGLDLDVPIIDWEKILESTSGLSGAYLGEVARRLKVHGYNAWEEEIESVKRASPKPTPKESNDEDEESSDGTTPASNEPVAESVG